jgi:hypothetical protein
MSMRRDAQPMHAHGREAAGGLAYARHRPEATGLYRLVEQHYPAFVAHLAGQGRALPAYVAKGFEAYLRCGRLELGFLRVRCDSCSTRAPVRSPGRKALVLRTITPLAGEERASERVAKAGRGRRTGKGSVQPERSAIERHAAMTWAQRLKRVFHIDVETCVRCGKAVRVIASIEEPALIERILAHVRAKEESRASFGPRSTGPPVSA